MLKQGLFALSVYEVYQWTDLFNSLKAEIERSIEVVMGEKDKDAFAKYYFEFLKEKTRVDLQRKYVACMNIWSRNDAAFQFNQS